jgi:hypothetical protein
MGEVTMNASALQTFVAVINGAYVLGEEAQPLEVTEDQARALLRDGLIVLAEGEALPEDAPKVQTPKVQMTKDKSAGGVL